MASCITEQWDGRSAPQLKLTVTNNSSAESEKEAVLSWKLEYIASYAASTGSSRSYSASINGSTVASGSYDINGLKGTYTIASGNKKITKTTSAQTISFSCSMAFNLTWSGNYAGTKSASGSIGVSKKTSYSVTYTANGGSGAPSSQTKWYGESLTLSKTKPTRTGCTFKEWNTGSTDNGTTGTGTSYSPGGAYTKNEPLSLYAIWTPLKYTISFNANGGTGAPSGQQKTYGTNLTITTKTPTRTNYTFLGWGTSSSSTTVAYKAGATYSKNAAITLYAIWQLNYTKPRIKSAKAYRCDSTGKITDSGTCIKVEFSWACDRDVTGIKVQYKLATASEWANTIELAAEGDSNLFGSNKIILGDGIFTSQVFDTEKAYKVDVLIADSGGYSYRICNVNAILYSIDILSGGKGIAFGKPATASKFDVAFPTNFDKDLISQGDVYAKGSNKCYTNADVIPIANGGTGTTSASAAAKAFGYGKILKSCQSWMKASSTVELPQNISEQPHGIALIFSEYKDNAAQEYGWNHFFISKAWITDHDGLGCNFTMNAGNFGAICCKYLYIFDDKIVGSDTNADYGTNNGVTYDNRRYMLRYVIGV